MPKQSDDIVTNVEINEKDILDLKKAHYDMGGGTRSPSPVAAAQAGLNSELLQQLKMGRKWSQFQGIDRCIRVLDPGAPSQRHCMAMMVKDMTRNMVVCSSCDRIRDLNAQPKTINSSMIKLSPKELEEFHMVSDPLENAKPEPVKKPKVANKERSQRRPKVTVPNSVKIEVSMEQLRQDPDVVKTLLNKTLESIYELPVKKFSEAEDIRIVAERVKKLLETNE